MKVDYLSKTSLCSCGLSAWVRGFLVLAATSTLEPEALFGELEKNDSLEDSHSHHDPVAEDSSPDGLRNIILSELPLFILKSSHTFISINFFTTQVKSSSSEVSHVLLLHH